MHANSKDDNIELIKSSELGRAPSKREEYNRSGNLPMQVIPLITFLCRMLLTEMRYEKASTVHSLQKSICCKTTSKLKCGLNGRLCTSASCCIVPLALSILRRSFFIPLTKNPRRKLELSPSSAKHV